MKLEMWRENKNYGATQGTSGSTTWHNNNERIANFQRIYLDTAIDIRQD